MSYIGFDVIDLAFDKTKQLLFPIKVKLWFKLLVLFLFVSGGSFSFGRSFSNSNNQVDSSELMLPLKDSLLNLWHQYYLLIIILGIFVLLSSLVYMFLKSHFTFSLLKSIDTKNVLVFGYFKQMKKFGWSYFIFNLFYSLITTIILIFFSIPVIKGLFSGSSLVSLWIYLFPMGLIILLNLIVLFVLEAFVVYYMYEKQKKVLESFIAVLKLIKKQWKEYLVFFFAYLLVGVCLMIICLIALICLVIPLIFLGIGAYFLLTWIYSSFGLIILLVVGIPMGLILLLYLVLGSILIFVPIHTFSFYYQLLFNRSLLKKYS